MADIDKVKCAASSQDFLGRDQVTPADFVVGSGNPRVFWPGIWDLRRFYSGIRDTVIWEYKSECLGFPRGLQIEQTYVSLSQFFSDFILAYFRYISVKIA